MLLEGLPWGQLTAGGMLLVAVWLILTGKILPKATLTELRADMEARIQDARKEADDWRAAFTAASESQQLQSQMLRELLENGKTSLSVLTALRETLERKGHQEL